MKSNISIGKLAAVLLIAMTAFSTVKADTAKPALPTTTLEVAQAFLKAAGSGDGAMLKQLMAQDFVWHNEGDKRIPWIGDWRGQDQVFKQFMPAFGSGLKVTSWTTDYSFVSGDNAVFMGSMSADTTLTGRNTGTMSWAVRVHVVNGKVKSWNWFEDSYAVSKAFRGE